MNWEALGAIAECLRAFQILLTGSSE